MQGSFVYQSAGAINVSNGTLSTITWTFHRGAYDDWEVKVSTKDHDLSPPSHKLPPELLDLYNVSVQTQGNVSNVTMDIIVNNRILDYVPYVFCRIYSYNTASNRRSENVRFNIITPNTSTEVTTGSNTYEPTMNTSTESNVDSTSGTCQVTLTTIVLSASFLISSLLFI